MANPKTKQKKYKDAKHNDLLCGLPDVPERQLDSGLEAGRAFLIRYIEKKWVNNTVLHFYFFNSPISWKGSDTQKDEVKKAFKKWKQLGIGIEFEEVDDPTAAEIRIGFLRGKSWSFVGRDVIDLNIPSNERSMNFGWDLTTAHGKDTAIHEIGHALGFPHEHQNPNSGIVWDEDAVYNNYSGPPNDWDRDTIFRNILRKISSSDVSGSKWDKDSIMHYSFSAGLITSPVEYQINPLIPAPGLSELDIKEVKKFYPATKSDEFPELKPFLSKIVKLSAGQQVDYIINPKVSRKYTMQTFGDMDMVMVLFEDDNGEPIYLAGDDDSGTNTNSKIENRLIKGRTYYLRLRLYYSTSVGSGGVMLW